MPLVLRKIEIRAGRKALFIMRQIMWFFCIFLFFSCSVSYSADHPSLTDHFVQYNYRNSLTLKKDNLMQVDCVSTHLQMKQQIDSVRSVFKGSGIEDLWKKEKGTSGNIASAVIEFVFNDGTSIKHPVNSLENQKYFTTIAKYFTSAIENEKDESEKDEKVLKLFEKMMNLFKDYRSTYQVRDLKQSDIFKKGNIGDRVEAYFDTEAQIIFYLFFKDLYREKLYMTLLHTRFESIRIMLVDTIQELIDKASKKDFEIIEAAQAIMSDMDKIPSLKQNTQILAGAIERLKIKDEGSQNTGWIQIQTVLPRIRTAINKDKTFLHPLAAPDVIAVILHIHTELDPCEKCRHLLSNLSTQMNEHKCDPQIFFKGAVSLPLPNARACDQLG